MASGINRQQALVPLWNCASWPEINGRSNSKVQALVDARKLTGASGGLDSLQGRQYNALNLMQAPPAIHSYLHDANHGFDHSICEAWDSSDSSTHGSSTAHCKVCKHGEHGVLQA